MGKLAGKKLLLLGERDGVPDPAMKACLKDSGAEILFSATEYFVWTAAGAMDLQNQQRVKNAANKYIFLKMFHWLLKELRYLVALIYQKIKQILKMMIYKYQIVENLNSKNGRHHY